jgi:hypothetical protein
MWENRKMNKLQTLKKSINVGDIDRTSIKKNHQTLSASNILGS